MFDDESKVGAGTVTPGLRSPVTAACGPPCDELVEVDRLAVAAIATFRSNLAKEMKMQIKDAMTADVHLANPQQHIRDVARSMAEIDAGVMPVADNDRLVGMVTDRDIAIRAIAAGKGPDTAVREIMSKDVKYCFEDDDIDDVAHNMGELKIRRLPVLNRDKRLVGIVSLGDIATANGPDPAGEALCEISEPGGEHSQSAS